MRTTLRTTQRKGIAARVPPRSLGDHLEDLDEDLDEDPAEYTDMEVYGEGNAEGLEYDSDEAGAEAAEGMRHRRGFARGQEPVGELDGRAVGEALPGGSQRRR